MAFLQDRGAHINAIEHRSNPAYFCMNLESYHPLRHTATLHAQAHSEEKKSNLSWTVARIAKQKDTYGMPGASRAMLVFGWRYFQPFDGWKL